MPVSMGSLDRGESCVVKPLAPCLVPLEKRGERRGGGKKKRQTTLLIAGVSKIFHPSIDDNSVLRSPKS